MHVTPTNFLDFISIFRNLVNTKDQYFKQQTQMLTEDLECIVRCAKEVECLTIKFKTQEA